MTTQEKNEIRELLLKQIEQIGSQNKLATKIKVSPATISQMIKGNWELISEEMWRTVGAFVGFATNTWNYVETRSFRLINQLLADAQNHANVFAFVGESGIGKTAACKSYCNTTKNAILLQCSDYWNKKHFLQEILTLLGKDSSGLNVYEMMTEIVKDLKTRHKPVLVIDEADKLSDQVMYFFITLYNELQDHCGMVLCATDHLEKRIKRGLKLNKKGYKEIYSRIGRKFVEIEESLLNDVIQICMANGISDVKIQKQIYLDASGDLRRVKRLIHAHKID